MKSGTQLSLIPPPEPPAGSNVRVAPVENARITLAGTGDDTAFGDIRLTSPDASEPGRCGTPWPDAVRTLNDGMGPPAVCTVAQGVFVPLEEFGRRGVQPSSPCVPHRGEPAGETNRNGPPTLSREFNGNPTVGIVLDPRCVSGLDLAGFAAPPAEGS